MRSKISVEPLAEFSSMGVVTEILSQPEIAMVALGSMACVASIQHTADLLGVEERLLVQGLSAREYGLGKNSKIAAQLLQKAVELPNIKGVIVYCSCLDVLTGWEEGDILSRLQIPPDVKIAFLYRGPLVKRKLLPRLALQQIWQQWNYEPVPMQVTAFEKRENPPAAKLQVDFKKAILEYEGNETLVLLSPGGCASCLYDVPPAKRSRIFNTRFDDLALSRLQAKDFVEAFKVYFPPKAKLLLLGSAVIKTVGIDLEEICKQLNKEGYQARCLPTDGFKGA